MRHLLDSFLDFVLDALPVIVVISLFSVVVSHLTTGRVTLLSLLLSFVAAFASASLVLYLTDR